jgi:hypothetical protein
MLHGSRQGSWLTPMTWPWLGQAMVREEAREIHSCLTARPPACLLTQCVQLLNFSIVYCLVFLIDCLFHWLIDWLIA